VIVTLHFVPLTAIGHRAGQLQRYSLDSPPLGIGGPTVEIAAIERGYPNQFFIFTQGLISRLYINRNQRGECPDENC
jgi:hypothetical protein